MHVLAKLGCSFLWLSAITDNRYIDKKVFLQIQKNNSLLTPTAIQRSQSEFHLGPCWESLILPTNEFTNPLFLALYR